MARRSPRASTEPSWAAPHALGERRAASRGRYPASTSGAQPADLSAPPAGLAPATFGIRSWSLEVDFGLVGPDMPELDQLDRGHICRVGDKVRDTNRDRAAAGGACAGGPQTNPR